MRREFFRWPVIVAAICGVFLMASVMLPQTAHAQNTEQDAGSPTLECEILSANPANWFICPLVVGMQETVNGLNKAIDAMLTIDTTGGERSLFNNTYKEVWNRFRIIAVGLVIVAGLAMLAMTAFGLEILDAYTVRKVLPRLVIAIIAISLSWEILKFLVTLSNDAGNGVRAMIYQPFREALRGSQFGTAIEIGNWTTFVGFLVGGAAIVAMGIAALFSFIATALLAVFIGFIILLGRQMIITILVLIAPFAIACYVLPNTQKVFDFWKGTLLSMLVVFPIISAFIATGRVFALVAYGNGGAGDIPIIQQISAFFAFFIPYLALPFAFRLAGGAIATIAGIATDRGRGGFDRLSGFRQNRTRQRFEDARNNKGGYVGANAAGAVYRRFTLPGGFNPTARGRARYRAANKQLLRNNADEALKNDNGFASGNDDANALALQDGMTRGRFLREYAAMQQARDPSMSNADAQRQAQDAMGELERGYGSQVGSDTMAVAAFKARAASNKGYDYGDYEANTRAMYNDAASLVNRGALSLSDAAAITKSNRDRPDASGVGFSAAMGGIAEVARRRQAGFSYADTFDSGDAARLSDEVLDGTDPGLLIRGRHEALTALAPQMVRRLQVAATHAETTGDTRAYQRELASVAGLYDELARTSPKKAKIMADEVFGREVTDSIGKYNKEGKLVSRGEKVTVREVMERARDAPANPRDAYHQSFSEMRRDFGNRYAAENDNQNRRDDYDLAG